MSDKEALKSQIASISEALELTDDQLVEATGGRYDRDRVGFYVCMGDYMRSLGLSKESYQKEKAKMAAAGIDPDYIDLVFRGIC